MTHTQKGGNTSNLSQDDSFTLMPKPDKETTRKENYSPVFMGNRWGNSGKQCQTLFWWAPKSLKMVVAAMKLKDAYSLEGKL